MSGDLVALFAQMERDGALPGYPWLTVMPQPPGRAAAVVAFTGRAVVAADVDPQWVHARLADGDLCAPLSPPFLTALSDKLGCQVGNLDAVLLADPATGPPSIPLSAVEDLDHPRVRRALRYREDVRVWTTPGGVLIIGRGLAGRWEMAIEVDEGSRNVGLGRQLAAAARHLIPSGRPIWAQVAPGNAASLRAILAAGFRPVGAEVLLVDGSC